MKNIALIFPGQGAQKVGMGRDFYESSAAARAVFDKAESFLGSGFLKVIFDGPEAHLTSTAFCQPAIFTVSMAALAACREAGKLEGVAVPYTAGLSLGEYGALCAAGTLSLEVALKLIRLRSSFMEEAAKLNPGTMAAVIGADAALIADCCRKAGCEIANYNAPDQIVITGRLEAVTNASRLLAEAGCRKIIPLDVAGAFHSSLMRSAADRFAAELSAGLFKESATCVVSNVSGKPQMSVSAIIGNLPAQIYSSVQWVETVRFLRSQGIEQMVEIGPGRVLKGLIKKIDSAIDVQNVQIFEDVAALAF